jgi:ribosomal protein S18 acetylase RimI-like enzyme
MPMTIQVDPLCEDVEKVEHCARLTAELPKWFGRPEANAAYQRGMATRQCFVAKLNETVVGLVALDHHFEHTCNVRWLGVSPKDHRQGVGRALIERAIEGARQRGCRYVTLETMSPRANSPEYDQTRLFYEAIGFEPLVEFEPSPGDFMMWMVYRL